MAGVEGWKDDDESFTLSHWPSASSMCIIGSSVPPLRVEARSLWKQQAMDQALQGGGC